MTGTSVAEVNVAGRVVATPLTVVTIPVVNVRTECERDVIGVVIEDESDALGVDEGPAEFEVAGVEDSMAVEVGRFVEVVGMTMGEEEDVIAMDELSTCCRR